MLKTLMNFFMMGVLALGLSACVTQIDNRGKPVEPEDLKRLRPHEHKKEDVQRLLGSPTLIDKFSPDTWFYLYRVTSSTAFFTPDEKLLKIVAVKFDKSGILGAVEVSGEKGTHPVSVVLRETPTKGREPGYLEQVFGNFGRIHRGSVSGE